MPVAARSSKPATAPPPRLPRHSIAPLTDEEVQFCWRGLVDEGKMSVPKLQRFMEQVAGHNLSAVQARDLIQYMDADGDGRVGKEDFRNFMSTPSLDHTDVKNFMWTPKAKFREKNPSVVAVSKAANADDALWSEEATAEGIDLLTALPGDDLGGFQVDAPEDTSFQRKISADSMQLQESTGTGSANLKEANESSKAGANATTLPAVRRPHEKTVSRKEHKRNVNSKGSLREKKMTVEPPRQLTAATTQAQRTAEPAAHGRQVIRIDPKTLNRIEATLKKYEQESWETFLKLETDLQRQMFNKFAAEPTHLTMQEYHKMVTTWFPLANWCAPGTLRPGDSLSTLEYFVRLEKQKKGAESAADAGAGKAPSSTTVAAKAEAAKAEADAKAQSQTQDPKMTYRLWLDILSGKYQPEGGAPQPAGKKSSS